MTGQVGRPAAHWGERGSAGMLTVTIVMCLMVAMMCGAWLLSWYGAAHRARVVADLSALAGAGAQKAGVDACQAARRTAAANGGSLADCQVTTGYGEFIVSVRAQVALSPRVPGGPTAIQADARAGSLRPAGG